MKRLWIAFLFFCCASLHGAGSALLVVGGTPLNAGDTAIYNALTATGYTVVTKLDNAATAADATGKALVFISESVFSVNVNTTFKSVAVPVIVSEAYLYDDMDLTGPTLDTDFGYLAGQTTISIVDASSPFANGNPVGPLTVFGSSQSVNWGIPAASADIVATVTGSPSQAVIFVYQQGQTMAAGFVAPALRVGFFPDNNASAAINPAAVSLLGQAIQVAATGESWTATPTRTATRTQTRTPTPTPSPTRSPTRSPTVTPTASPSVTPGNSVALKLYDQNGELVASSAACAAAQPIASFSAEPNPWNPALGALQLHAGSWRCSFEAPQALKNGSYRLELDSQGASGKSAAWAAVVVLDDPGSVSAYAYPNPAGKGSRSVGLYLGTDKAWSVKVYALNGSLVASLAGSGSQALAWDIQHMASGIYLAAFDCPGSGKPKVLKIAVAR